MGTMTSMMTVAGSTSTPILNDGVARVHPGDAAGQHFLGPI